MPWVRLAAQRYHLVGIDPNFFEVCSPAMHTHSILRLSRSNALDLLKLATLALHPLVDRLHFCDQHGYLLRFLATMRQSVLQKGFIDACGHCSAVVHHFNSLDVPSLAKVVLLLVSISQDPANRFW